MLKGRKAVRVAFGICGQCKLYRTDRHSKRNDIGQITVNLIHTFALAYAK